MTDIEEKLAQCESGRAGWLHRHNLLAQELRVVRAALSFDPSQDRDLETCARRIYHGHADALRESARLRTWVNELHAGMTVNCVYCGHNYGPSKDTPVAMADVLKAHIEVCPEHPMSKLKAELDEYRSGFLASKTARGQLAEANRAGMEELVNLRKKVDSLELAADVIASLAKLVTNDDGIDPEAFWLELTHEQANQIKLVAKLAGELPQKELPAHMENMPLANVCEHGVPKGYICVKCEELFRPRPQ